jgi:hypothetical protein
MAHISRLRFIRRISLSLRHGSGLSDSARSLFQLRGFRELLLQLRSEAFHLLLERFAVAFGFLRGSPEGLLKAEVLRTASFAVWFLGCGAFAMRILLRVVLPESAVPAYVASSQSFDLWNPKAENCGLMEVAEARTIPDGPTPPSPY